MGGPPPQLRPVDDQGGGHQDHEPDDDDQGRDGQQLGGEEELAEEEQGQRHARPHGAWRWRIRISSRTARMSGSSMSAAVMRWANSRLVSTKGEKP